MIVMKFGGTSVQDAQAIDRVAAIVRERLNERPVVVVSALAKITDQLLAMSAAAGAGDRTKALELSRSVRERHCNCACELLGTHAFEQIAPELEADFNGLDELLRGVVAVGELTPRTIDTIAGFGAALLPWASSRRGPSIRLPALASECHRRLPPQRFPNATSKLCTLIPANASLLTPLSARPFRNLKRQTRVWRKP